MSNESDSQEKAWEFIMYLIDHGAIGMYESGDRIPAKLTDQAEETIQSNAYSKAFIAQIQNGEPMPTVFTPTTSAQCGLGSCLLRLPLKIW